MMSLLSLAWIVHVIIAGLLLLILAICLKPTKKEESK